MKINEVRELLERMNAADLRLVAAQLYKMLPKKMAEEKRANELLSDPQSFVSAQAAKPRKAPALPDPDWLGFETNEFLAHAEKQNYFAPNREIPKSERSQWRFLARRLYREWGLLAASPEHQAGALDALTKLYKILCRGCEVYLFPSTDTFRAIGVPQQDFFEQVILLQSQLRPPDQWIPQALSLLEAGAHGDTTSNLLHDVIVKTLKTPELKVAASETITRHLLRKSIAAEGKMAREPWEMEQRRHGLLRLGFQIIWALGEKERAWQWLQTHVRSIDDAGHFMLLHALETKDRDFWMHAYETLRHEAPASVKGWQKTYEQAQREGQLPAWRIN
jgi:hypothetical protein